MSQRPYWTWMVAFSVLLMIVSVGFVQADQFEVFIGVVAGLIVAWGALVGEAITGGEQR